MPVIKPGTDVKPDPNLMSIFLAGSIEMGKARGWQKEVGSKLGDKFNVYDPRRDDWDISWTDDNQELTNQILWEQEKLALCGFVLFYFDPETKSPITLLELGQCLQRDQYVCVVCPKGYWRRLNVELTCRVYGVIIREDLNEVVDQIIEEMI